MMQHKTPLILLTNDDGFFSPGIEALRTRFHKDAQVTVVAPDRERSATSLALTLHHPLRIKSIRKNIYSVDGTPADCVYIAVQKLLSRKPDLLISGINPGPNLGQQDISYSGTVAGALQGTFLSIPSLAVSLSSDEKGHFSFDEASDMVYGFAQRILSGGSPEGITYNINIPPPPIKGIRLVPLGQKRYNPEIIMKTDPRNRTYYWIGTGTPEAVGGDHTDVHVIKEGYITVTPLHRDMTAYPLLNIPQTQRIFKD